MNFFRNKRAAAIQFGVADARPQDTDRNFMKELRLRNTAQGESLQLPSGYERCITNWIENWNIEENLPVVQKLKPFEERQTTLVDSEQKLMEVSSQLAQTQYVGLDFEFHDEFSYDGFVCVASISNDVGDTFVLDTICSDRKAIIAYLKQLLLDDAILKIVHGCDNDILRLHKDWDCYPVGVLDTQDLFSVWKNFNSDECWDLAKDSILEHVRKLWSANSKPGMVATEADLQEKARKYFSESSSSYDLLVAICVTGKVGSKDTVATFADWRVRPLQSRLLQYSANDTAYLGQIALNLYEKIGRGGFQTAARLTKMKMVNVGQLRRFKMSTDVKTSCRTMANIVEWRDYLARMFDRTPTQVLEDHNLTPLQEYVDGIGVSDLEKLGIKLQELKINDDFQKSARLLAVYMDNDSAQRDRMASIDCHNCNRVGHTAYFCPFDGSKDLKKANRNRPENLQHKQSLNKSKWQKYCSRKNISPLSPPWMRK